MKLLVDMNLSPKWSSILRAEGWDTVHWSDVGDAKAPDTEIMRWAASERRVVLTHDLDFGALLATTQVDAPSVVQVRTQDVRPQSLARLLVPLLHQYESQLDSGALLVVDEAHSRVRLLPITKQ
jgi:predicted nuclease of predicted toxin-antitoxin system